MRYIALIFVLGILGNVAAQEDSTMLSGIITGVDGDDVSGLIGANVYWVDSEIGTTTDFEGRFEIPRDPQTKLLVLSYVGYRTDTIEVSDMPYVEITMNNSVDLQAVEVVFREKSTKTSLLETIKVDNISERELQKAACCSLSESFETNASVDVSHTDAVTGRKQIEMLGLASPYIQMNRENMPFMEGMAASTGFDLTPGPWIESIQLSKGIGSVVNGHNGISGQINTELRKPMDTDKWYLNLFANQMGRVEFNTHTGFDLGDSDWSSAVLLHARRNGNFVDNNDDSFVDVPKNRNYIGMNRWEYHDERGNHFQAGVKGVLSSFEAGQLAENQFENPWITRSDVNKVDFWLKNGKVFLDMPWKTYGFQLYGSTYKNDSKYSDLDYLGRQTEVKANFIFQTILSNIFHTIKMGASYEYRQGREEVFGLDLQRNENTYSTYGEYVYDPKGKFSALVGLRFDYHNDFGFFWNPRVMLRYQPWEEASIRVTGGKGWRSPSLFADNLGYFASNRAWDLGFDRGENYFDVDPEEAWNLGTNFTQKFMIGQRAGVISLDYYYTSFLSQIVTDLDAQNQTVLLYNLDGSSYSHAGQAQMDFEIVPRLDLRLAYRYTDVQTMYRDSNLRQKPFVSKHRAFVNLAYETPSEWKFDWTVNRVGSQRLPNTMPTGETMSPAYWLMNGQVSKSWPSSLEVYVGAENLTNYRQENPIYSAENPYDPSFDAAMIWGPIAGRVIYTGLRYRIPRSQ